MAENHKSNCNRTVENFSLRELLDWINEMVKTRYMNVEELCSGIAYCQIIESLFPGSVGAKQIKIPARFAHEKIHNLKLLQGALFRLDVDKAVPIEKIIRGRFQDNYHFLTWFKKFYDSQGAVGYDNFNDDDDGAKEHDENFSLFDNKPVAYVIPLLSTEEGEKKKSLARVAVRLTRSIEWTNIEAATDEDDEPLSMKELQDIFDDFLGKLDSSEWDRNEAYNKLRKIEMLLNKTIEKGRQLRLCNHFLNAIYESDNGSSHLRTPRSQ